MCVLPLAPANLESRTPSRRFDAVAVALIPAQRPLQFITLHSSPLSIVRKPCTFF